MGPKSHLQKGHRIWKFLSKSLNLHHAFLIWNSSGPFLVIFKCYGSIYLCIYRASFINNLASFAREKWVKNSAIYIVISSIWKLMTELYISIHFRKISALLFYLPFNIYWQEKCNHKEMPLKVTQKTKVVVAYFTRESTFIRKLWINPLK